MKLHKILFLSFVFFLGCDDDDDLEELPKPEPVPVTVFSLSVEQEYAFKNDHWVMVHDKNGVLLDYKKIQAGGVVEFQTAEPVPDAKIGITIFKYEITGSTGVYIFESYLSIPTGETWFWKKPAIPTEVNQGASVGTFSATYTLPSPLRMDLFGNSTTLGSFNQTGNTKSYQSAIYEKDKNFLLTVAGEGNPRYKFFENVKNGDYFQVTFDDMLEYDKILDISFPPTLNPYVTVYSLDGDGKAKYYTYFNTFNLPPFGPSVTLTNLKIGYLNRFEKYYTNIQIPTSDFGFGYEKVGAAPSPFSFPDHSYYAVTDKTLTGFSYSNEKPFSMRSSGFRDDSLPDKQIWWTFYAPEGTDKVAELPDDFVEMYPFIKLQNFKHLRTSFQNSTKSYMGYVDRIGKGISESKEFETTIITVQ